MANETRKDMDILRLCPNEEESLCDLAASVVEVLLTPKERIRNSDQARAQIIMDWGRRIIKFGSCSSFSHLSGVDCIESLYKQEAADFVKGLSRFKEQDDFILLGKLIMISCINDDLKSLLLKQVVRKVIHSSSEETSLFMCEMWKMRDEMSVEVVEELILGFPLCLEKFLLDVVENIIANENADVNNIVNLELNSFCQLCSNSPIIFQVVLSILHEFLLISDVHDLLFQFITTFVCHVENCCQKGDFLDLFPLQQRFLVSLLRIKPSLYPDNFIDSDFTKTNVFYTLSRYIQCNRRVGGALLSYFPEWLPHVYKYCVQHNISELIPRRKEDGKMKETYLKFILQNCV